LKADAPVIAMGVEAPAPQPAPAPAQQYTPPPQASIPQEAQF
jgi:hypothetical protein